MTGRRPTPRNGPGRHVTGTDDPPPPGRRQFWTMGPCPARAGRSSARALGLAVAVSAIATVTFTALSTGIVVGGGASPASAASAARSAPPGPAPTASLSSVASGAAGSPPAATAALPEPTWTPPEVRDAADDVLDGAEFQRPEPNLLDRARAWVEERIGRVLQDLVTGDGASVLGWIVLLASIVAIALLLARLGRSVQRDPGRAASVSVERARTSSQWTDEAERLEGERQWKLALRCRFRALVATLVEQGRVDDVPGRTAGEYRTEIDAALAEAAADFAEATYLFEDAWYGDEPTGQAENERFRSLAAAVVTASATHRAEGASGPVVTESEAVSA